MTRLGTAAADASRASAPVRPLAIAAIGSASGLVPPFLVAALAVQMQAELSFGATRLGVATGGFFVAAGLSALWGGRVADRLGWRTAVLLATSCSGVGLLAVAVGAHSYEALLATLGVAAAGNAIAQPTSNLILAREVDERRLGLAFGIKQASVPLAMLVAGASVPVFAVTVSWRAAFACTAVLPLATATLAWTHPPPRPAATALATSSWPHGTAAWVVGAALAAAQVGALNTFAVVTAVGSGITPSSAGWLLVGVSLVGLATRVFLGWTLDARTVRPLHMVAGLLAVGAAGCATMAVGTPTTVVAGLLLAVMGGWGWGGVFLYAVVRRHPEAPASASGAVQAGISVGLGSGPLAFGALAEASSTRTAWMAAAGITAVAAAWMLGVGRHENAGLDTAE